MLDRRVAIGKSRPLEEVILHSGVDRNRYL